MDSREGSALIARMLAREPEALEEFQTAYTPLLRYIIAPILPDARDREECLADAVHRAWENISRFDRTNGSFPGWLSVLARNTALNHARHNARHDNGAELSEHTPSPEHTPEETVLLQERQKAVRAALGRLSNEDRILFYRKYYYMQPTAQIAAELGLTERAVEGRLYRLKKHLRRLLGGEDRA